MPESRTSTFEGANPDSISARGQISANGASVASGPSAFDEAAYRQAASREGLTEKQIEARLRMKRIASECASSSRAERQREGCSDVEEPSSRGDHLEDDWPAIDGISLDSGQTSSSEQRDDGFAIADSRTRRRATRSSREGSVEYPPIVYDPAQAPVGPPWKYDLTEEEIERRRAKRARRSEVRKNVKEKALKKTPQTLKNPTDLQVRFRTAVVYTLVTILCVLGGDISTIVYLMAVAGVCAGEFYYMLRSDAKLPNEVLGIGGAVLYIPAVYFLGMAGAILVTIALLLALLIWYVFWLHARVQDVGVSLFGAVYTGLMLCGFVVIIKGLEYPFSAFVMFLMFLSVWANDAFAYMVGSKIGKHKLAPRTSPKKSWEGLIAGLVGSVLVWVIIAFIPGVSLEPWMAVVFGIVCGLAGVLGDLAESRIKRNSGFKDSGTIMPGHGGLLDRCDSLFLVSVTAALMLVAFGCLPAIQL